MVTNLHRFHTYFLLLFVALIIFVAFFASPQTTSEPIAACEQHEDPYDHYECYQERAVLHKDQGLCDHITGNLHWTYSCVSLVGAATGDATVCATIPNGIDYRDACYCSVAEMNNDVSLCDFISDQHIKDHCSICGGYLPGELIE